MSGVYKGLYMSGDPGITRHVHTVIYNMIAVLYSFSDLSSSALFTKCYSLTPKFCENLAKCRDIPDHSEWCWLMTVVMVSCG